MEKLQELITSHNLPEDMAARIRTEFGSIFNDLEAAQKEAESLVVVTGDEPDAATAAAAQKAAAKMRIAVEKLRTELKAPYLRMGQAIDGIAKSLATAIEPLETKLKALAGTKSRLEAEAKTKLIESRKLQLTAIGFVGEVDGIGDLSDQVWQMILEGHAARIKMEKEAAERAEAERQAEEQRIANERAEAARIAKLGQSRREALLMLGLDASADELATMSEEDYEWAYQSAAKAKQDKADRESLKTKRMMQLLGLGIGVQVIDGMLTLGNYFCDVEAIPDTNESDWQSTIEDFRVEAESIAEAVRKQNEYQDRRSRRKAEMERYGAISDGAEAVNWDALSELSEEKYQEALATQREAFESEQTFILRRNELRATGLWCEDADGFECTDPDFVQIAPADLDYRITYDGLRRCSEEHFLKLLDTSGSATIRKNTRKTTASVRVAQLSELCVKVSIEEVQDLTDDQFAAQLQYAEAQFKIAQEEKIRITLLERQRADALEAYGATGTDLASLGDDQWAECLAAAKGAYESSLSEQDRIKEIIDALTSVSNGMDPSKFSPKSQKKIQAAQAFVRNAIASLA